MKTHLRGELSNSNYGVSCFGVNLVPIGALNHWLVNCDDTSRVVVDNQLLLKERLYIE